MDTDSAWEAYNVAADATGATGSARERTDLDNAVADVVQAERAAVFDQLYLVAVRPDSPIQAKIVRPVTVAT